MVPALFETWAEMVVNQTNIKPGDRVLDVACGTGVLARAAAKKTGSRGSVTGVDLNPGMLAVAGDLSPDIKWHEGVAEDLPWENKTFDAVVSQFGMMFFEDKPKALREMHRVLKPGGRMTVAVFDSLDNIPCYRIMTDIFGRVAGDEVAQALRLPFSLGDPVELRAICDESGLTSANVTTLQGKARFPDVKTIVLADVKGWFPLAGIDLSDQQIDDVVKSAESELRNYVTEDGLLEFPIPAHVITFEKN